MCRKIACGLCGELGGTLGFPYIRKELGNVGNLSVAKLRPVERREP